MKNFWFLGRRKQGLKHQSAPVYPAWKNINTASQHSSRARHGSRLHADAPATRPNPFLTTPGPPPRGSPTLRRPGREGGAAPIPTASGRHRRGREDLVYRLRRAQTPRGHSLHVLPRPNSPRDALRTRLLRAGAPQRRPLLSPESSVGRDPSWFGLGPIPSRAGKQFLRVILSSLGWIPLFLLSRTTKPSFRPFPWLKSNSPLI